MIKAIINIPDETMEKAVEQALAKIEEDTSIEACCDSCAYEAMAETQYPCNECRYSHKSMWRAKQ